MYIHASSIGMKVLKQLFSVTTCVVWLIYDGVFFKIMALLVDNWLISNKDDVS